MVVDVCRKEKWRKENNFFITKRAILTPYLWGLSVFATAEETRISIATKLGIGLCYSGRTQPPFDSPARRVPQNPARNAGFCTSALPAFHRFTWFIFAPN